MKFVVSKFRPCIDESVGW